MLTCAESTNNVIHRKKKRICKMFVFKFFRNLHFLQNSSSMDSVEVRSVCKQKFWNINIDEMLTCPSAPSKSAPIPMLSAPITRFRWSKWSKKKYTCQIKIKTKKKTKKSSVLPLTSHNRHVCVIWTSYKTAVEVHHDNPAIFFLERSLFFSKYNTFHTGKCRQKRLE